MMLITGRVGLNNNLEAAYSFPRFSSTRINQQYNDSQVILETVQHISNTTPVSSLFHAQSLQAVIVADAHLFNRSELKKQIHRINDEKISDAELILWAYQKWGKECLNYLTGNFAFAIWDKKAQQLLLGRDISGQRSLFYYIDANQVLYFASLPRFLVELPGFRKKMNKEKLAHFLTLLPSDNRHTFFQEIDALPAAHRLICKLSNATSCLERYWSAAELVADPLVLDPREHRDAFQLLFRDVVSDYIPKQGLTVSHLSGGLDSSSVTCMAASILEKDPLMALCHVPAGKKMGSPYAYWSYDDRLLMQAVENTYANVTNHYISSNKRALFDYSDTLHPWLDTPTVNPTNNLWFIDSIEKTQQLGATSLLTGQRGNSSISWTGSRAPTISTRQAIKHVLRTPSRYLLEKLAAHGILRPWIKLSGISSALARETNLYRQYHQKYRQKNHHACADFRIYYADHMIDTLGTAAFPNALRFLYGVELLDPTADKRIIEFCLRTPPELFANEDGERLLVKHGLQDLIPICIRERTTRGMQAADWCNNVDAQRHELIKTLLGFETNIVANYLDIPPLLKSMETWNIRLIESSHGKKYHQYAGIYQYKLLRAIETGLFIQYHFGKQ